MNATKKISTILAGATLLALAANPIAEASSLTLNLKVAGTPNPWFAGMPDGYRYGSDTAPAQSPTEVLGLPLTAGSTLSLTASGGSRLCAGCGWVQGAEGLPSSVHLTGGINGISQVNTPFTSLMGVFLGTDAPQLTPTPNALDFSTIASRNYLSLSPELKQVFFIGDGRTSAGEEQRIIVPNGASRFYLGMADSVGHYFNNHADFDVKITALSPSEKRKSVPEASSTIALLALGLVGAISLLKRKEQIS